MKFAIWTPPKPTIDDPQAEIDHQDSHWCHNALDVTDSLSSGSRTPTFELEGLEGLKIHDFFTDQAYLSRWNTRFADCVVSPESRRLGVCDGNSTRGEKFVGVSHLVVGFRNSISLYSHVSLFCVFAGWHCVFWQPGVRKCKLD